MLGDDAPSQAPASVDAVCSMHQADDAASGPQKSVRMCADVSPIPIAYALTC
jgi:hypothetical protein